VKMDMVWPPLESSPDIFNNLMHELGVTDGICVNEVYGFDPDVLAWVPPGSKAAIACVRRLSEKKMEDKARGDVSTECSYYMKQSGTLDNACGCIALLHSVLNNSSIELKDGSPLAEFRAANATTSPDERSASLESCKPIHDMYLHYQVAAEEGHEASTQEMISHDLDSEGNKIEGKSDEIKTFHFIAYVINDKNQLLEMDGTKQGPWVIAEGVEPDQLLIKVGEEMQRRLADGEIDPEAASMMAIGPPAE